MKERDETNSGIDPEELCKSILDLNESIRFVGIANRMGKVVAAKQKEGIQLLLTREELENDTIKAVLRMKTRENSELKLGKPLYTTTVYEKAKRASIELDALNYALLMVSFEISANHEDIIVNQILPLIRQKRLSESSAMVT